jgi:hypothetical protein
MEDRIDACINGCMRRMLPFLLIAWNWITDRWNDTHEWGVKTLHAIEHAHKDDVWIFFDANHRPYHAKHDWPGIPNNGLVYYPESKIFLLHNRIIPTPGIRRFDIVSAVLSAGSNSERIECTSFFLEVGWKGLAAPSLVEMIHLFGVCVKGKPYTNEQINSFTLHVMDSEGDDYDIPLESTTAQRRFTGWS